MSTLTLSVEYNSGYETLRHVVYANGVDPDVVGRFDSWEDVRGFLFDHSRFNEDDLVLLRDADGNGSGVVIPIAWLGDGEKLVGSCRVLDRMQ